MRILSSKDVGRPAGAQSGPVQPKRKQVVRPILEGVRKRGDRALLEYARPLRPAWNAKAVRVPDKELSAAAERLSPAFRDAVETASANIRAYSPNCQMPREWRKTVRPGLKLGPDRAAARHGGRLHPGGPLPAALHRDDDGRSGAGGGRAQHLRLHAARGQLRSSVWRTCWAWVTCFRWAARRPSPPSPSARRPCPARTAS